MLVAPSLVTRKPGERIKTDRRDARKRALLFRAGLLSEVQPLTEEDEAARDLSRAREGLREDLARARHRLGKFLLRRGITSTPGKRAWTTAHRRWLESLHFDNPVETAVVADCLLAIEQIEQRTRSLLCHIERLAVDARYAKTVATPCCKAVVAIARELSGFVWAAPSPLAQQATLHRRTTAHS